MSSVLRAGGVAVVVQVSTAPAYIKRFTIRPWKTPRRLLLGAATPLVMRETLGCWRRVLKSDEWASLSAVDKQQNSHCCVLGWGGFLISNIHRSPDYHCLPASVHWFADDTHILMLAQCLNVRVNKWRTRVSVPANFSKRAKFRQRVTRLTACSNSGNPLFTALWMGEKSFLVARIPKLQDMTLCLLVIHTINQGLNEILMSLYLGQPDPDPKISSQCKWGLWDCHFPQNVLREYIITSCSVAFCVVSYFYTLFHLNELDILNWKNQTSYPFKIIVCFWDSSGK